MTQALYEHMNNNNKKSLATNDDHNEDISMVSNQVVLLSHTFNSPLSAP
jgi:hypothetical protein